LLADEPRQTEYTTRPLSRAMNMAARTRNMPSMASQDKQQKRAQRAKAKAKQNRSVKPKGSVIHPLLANPLVNEPFDDVEVDLSL
jgi:predicted Zn-dependent protease